MGDDILREFAMVVQLCLEPNDKLVRWGGEEFVVFTAACNCNCMQAKAESVRSAIERHSWVHKASLTCSIGVAEMEEERFSEVIARADDALYQAKNSGRNRVILAHSQTEMQVLSA
jgi:diguanylate cyclase (GGDEF)-like protein